MAGSLKSYIYQSTILTANSFWIRADESNVEAVNPTPDAWTAGDTLIGRPFNMRPRQAVYEGFDANGGRVVIRIPILLRATGLQDLPASFDVPSNQIGAADITVVRRGITQERLIGQPIAIDTGRTDGDQP